MDSQLLQAAQSAHPMLRPSTPGGQQYQSAHPMLRPSPGVFNKMGQNLTPMPGLARAAMQGQQQPMMGAQPQQQAMRGAQQPDIMQMAMQELMRRRQGQQQQGMMTPPQQQQPNMMPPPQQQQANIITSPQQQQDSYITPMELHSQAKDIISSIGGNVAKYAQLPGAPKQQDANQLPAQAADLIKKFEGFSPKAYSDYSQYSVGYGTRGRKGQIVTEEEASDMLNKWVQKDYKTLAPIVGDKLNNQQHSALLSFSYNTGIGRAKKLAKYIAKGDMAAAQRYHGQFTRAGGKVLPGLVDRRKQEANLLFGE